MGTRYKRIIVAVLMCTHNLCFGPKKSQFFRKKIIIFTAVKNCSILHWRVCVINRNTALEWSVIFTGGGLNNLRTQPHPQLNNIGDMGDSV